MLFCSEYLCFTLRRWARPSEKCDMHRVHQRRKAVCYTIVCGVPLFLLNTTGKLCKRNSYVYDLVLTERGLAQDLSFNFNIDGRDPNLLLLTKDSERICWNQLCEPPIKPHVNNSSKWRRRAEIKLAPSPGQSAFYRFWANARPLSEPGVVRTVSVSQSTSAVIKSADKAGNKPKTIRIHYWLLCAAWRLITSAWLRFHRKWWRDTFSHSVFHHSCFSPLVNDKKK